MELHGHWRHELKYQIGPAAHLALRQRLRTIMEPDPHAGADGLYTIRSIYFDNYRDKALREKLDGVQTREKFRIRYYNDDLSFITLEKKIKHNDLCQKLDAPSPGRNTSVSSARRDRGCWSIPRSWCGSCTARCRPSSSAPGYWSPMCGSPMFTLPATCG